VKAIQKGRSRRDDVNGWSLIRWNKFDDRLRLCDRTIGVGSIGATDRAQSSHKPDCEEEGIEKRAANKIPVHDGRLVGLWDMRGDTAQCDAGPLGGSAADGPKDRPHAGGMVDSERIEVPCMGSADAERGHGDQSHYRDGRNFKQLVHRGSPAFILRISLTEFYGCSDER
jgi:hypothetical protein